MPLNLLSLPDQRELLHKLLLNVNDAVIVINEQRQIVLFNHAAELIFRCTEPFALSQPLDTFIPDRYHPHHAKHIERFHAEGITQRGIGGGMKLFGLRADGEEFPAEVSVARANILDRWYSIAVVRDTTEQERDRARIEELNKVLEDRVAERTQHLIRLNQEKNEFLAIAAHDLRNPLAGIAVSAELIEMYARKGQLDKLQPEKMIAITADILESASRMTVLLEEMLDVGKIEFGEKGLHTTLVESTIIDQMCDAYGGRGVVKNITIHLHTAPDAPEAFYGDSHAMLRILDNLLSNALKYSPIGGQVWVSVSRHRTDDEQVWLRVSVRDSGPGISSEDIEKLFQKFVRLSAKPTGGEPSTGLGLWIVKQLVEAMHGNIWCESAPGQGATFVVEFPSIA
jgi:PAS domain S-box-containing protein